MHLVDERFFAAGAVDDPRVVDLRIDDEFSEPNSCSVRVPEHTVLLSPGWYFLTRAVRDALANTDITWNTAPPKPGQ